MHQPICWSLDKRSPLSRLNENDFLFGSRIEFFENGTKAARHRCIQHSSNDFHQKTNSRELGRKKTSWLLKKQQLWQSLIDILLRGFFVACEHGYNFLLHQFGVPCTWHRTPQRTRHVHSGQRSFFPRRLELEAGQHENARVGRLLSHHQKHPGSGLAKESAMAKERSSSSSSSSCSSPAVVQGHGIRCEVGADGS